MRAGDEAFEALQKAIEALADAEAAELVAEARVEARAKVRTILAEAMAQALLDRSQAELSSPSGETSRAGSTRRSPRRAERSAPRAEPEPVQPERPAAGGAVPADEGVTGSADELGWYVYGVVGDTALDLPQSLSGVDEAHQVRLLREGDLAAVASQVPLIEFGEETLHESVNDVEWLERMARAHERVLDEVRTRSTVIPMRLCTIYRSESSVGQMLVRERRALSEALERLTGKTEWGLKIFVEPAVVEGAAKAASPELAKLDAELEGASAGEAYMRRKQVEGFLRDETDRLIDECVEDVHSRLSKVAVEALRNPLQRQEASGHSAPMVLNGVYLLDDAATDEFHSCVTALADEYRGRGCELEATGPWPPYNFVKSSIEAAW